MRGATLRQLRAFSLVARHQSFARAASELHLTPSAVSLQIKELEQSIGVTLFGRTGRTSCLTPVGEILLMDVNRALTALKDADNKLTGLQGPNTGVVSVAMVSNAKYFMPRFLAQFHTAHPDIVLRVSVGNREQVLRQLANRDVDIAIMGQPPEGLDVRTEPLATQPLAILAAPEHALADSAAIPAAALAGCDFIVRESGSGTRATMDRFFDEARISPPRVMELTCIESIKQAVIANMGLGFLSLHTTAWEIQAKALVVLDVIGLPLMRRWHMVSLSSPPVGNAADSLRGFISEFGNGIITRQFEGIHGDIHACGADPARNH